MLTCVHFLMLCFEARVQLGNRLLISLCLTFCAAAKSLQLYPTLCDPIDGSPSGSPVPGILQAGTLEWVAISFSNSGKWKVKGKSLSRVRLLATPWTVAYQAPLSMGFSRQEYWSGVPSPSPLHSVTVHSNLLGTWHPLSQQLFFKQKKIYSLSRDFVGQGKFLMFTYMLLRCEPWVEHFVVRKIRPRGPCNLSAQPWLTETDK